MADVKVKIGIQAGGLIEAMHRFSDALNGFGMAARYRYFEEKLTRVEREWFR